jgi:GR25 family glycosyltransferase involved in LPS biosynthesis
MKIYVISLKRRPDRLQKVLDKFAECAFTNFEVVEAIDGQHETYESLGNHYHQKRAANIQRPLTIGEICTSLSHQKAYQRILCGNDTHGIVIEDDCPVTEELIHFCNSAPPPVDIALLGYYTSNETAYCGTYKAQSYSYAIMDVCSESRVYFTNTSVGNLYKFDPKTRTVDFLHGAHCYCISKQGCTTIISFNYPVMVEADNVWNYHQGIDVYGIRPMLVDIDRQRADSDLEYDRATLRNSTQFSTKFLQRIDSPLFGI